RAAFGDRAGFLIGWYCWANSFVSWAANAVLLVDLLGERATGYKALPHGNLIAAAIVLAFGAINYFGVKPGARLVNLAVIGKIGAILCFLAAASFAFDPSRLGRALPLGADGVRHGVFLALFPLQGFEVTPVTAGETANPRRNVPLATMGALLFSALLFVAVQAALCGSFPGVAAESDHPLVDGARYLGPRIGLIVLVGSFVSIGGFTAGSAL